MDIVLLNIRPDYDVIVPLICSCRCLNRTWQEHAGLARPELHGITIVRPEPDSKWFDYVDQNWRVRTTTNYPIVADKHWYGFHALSYYSIMSRNGGKYTRIVAHGHMLTIIEGSIPHIYMRTSADSACTWLYVSATESRRVGFVRSAQFICDYLGLSAQQMLAAINEILG